MMKILLIHQDKRIAKEITHDLAVHGVRVFAGRTAKQGLSKFLKASPHLVLLGETLPDLPLCEVISRLRMATDRKLPMIVLSHPDIPPKTYTQLLDEGADQILTIPLDMSCLRAVIRATSRGIETGVTSTLRFGGEYPLELDLGTRIGKRGFHQFELTVKEYDLLELFMRNPRMVLSRDLIYQRVWGYDFGGMSNVIEVYIRYLRQKTEINGTAPRLLHTMRGMGYVLREEWS